MVDGRVRFDVGRVVRVGMFGYVWVLGSGADAKGVAMCRLNTHYLALCLASIGHSFLLDCELYCSRVQLCLTMLKSYQFVPPSTVWCGWSLSASIPLLQNATAGDPEP